MSTTRLFIRITQVIACVISRCIVGGLEHNMSTYINDINECCRKGLVDKLKSIHAKGRLVENLQNSSGLYGYKPLHVAAASNQKEVIQYLLSIDEPRKHIEGRASSNYTPLHLAVSFGSTQCVETLLRYKAEINAKDSYGKTPLDIANDKKIKKIIMLLKKESKFYNRFISMNLITQVRNID